MCHTKAAQMLSIVHEIVANVRLGTGARNRQGAPNRLNIHHVSLISC